ncbi:MAG: SpoVR family protein [bacterium]|nr:SpoVR family protein [bacterium]
MNWTTEDLKNWHDKIFEKAVGFGLDPYEQEFEICDHEQMISYMAYSGIPSHYPHWSYGKAFEKTKTLYDYGVTGLPYEMVINSNPAIAYLMKGNSLCLQLLTMAHVYGHNDFFKNNFTFKSTDANYVIEDFMSHAKRVRGYIEHPFIGLEKVEAVLDAAHALSLQQRRNLARKKLTHDEQIEMVRDQFRQVADPFGSVHKREKFDDEGFKEAMEKNPLAPEEDILLFIRDNARLSEWEKDLLTIVHDEAQYFIPQIETKIMNEGWASYWHKKIMDSLNLDFGLAWEFAKNHAQVLSPHPGQLNPYHLGIKLWENIAKRWDEPSKGDLEKFGKRNFENADGSKKTGSNKLFEVREADRDQSFIRQYLTMDLMRELKLFEYAEKEQDGQRVLVVTKVPDDDNWQAMRDQLIASVGMSGVPVIKVEDSNYRNNRALLLKHYHNGKDLQLEYAEKTIGYIRQLWGRSVGLETVINGRRAICFVDDNGGFDIKPIY